MRVSERKSSVELFFAANAQSGTLEDIEWTERIHDSKLSATNIENYDYCMVFTAEKNSKGIIYIF